MPQSLLDDSKPRRHVVEAPARSSHPKHAGRSPAAPSSRCPSTTHRSPAATPCASTSTRTPSPPARASREACKSSPPKASPSTPSAQPVEAIVAAHFGLAARAGAAHQRRRRSHPPRLPAPSSTRATKPSSARPASSCTTSSDQHDDRAASCRVQADDTLAFPFERFLAAITPRTKLIIVASPNNPTGATVTPRAAPRHRRRRAAGRAHGRRSLLPLPRRNHHGRRRQRSPTSSSPALLKAYGLANLRVGMLAGDAAPHRLSCARSARPTTSTA